LWYAEFGRGTPVILLHGGAANSRWWRQQIPALRTRFRVIVLDNRGHGRSTGTGERLTFDRMASDVVALMGYLHIRRAAVVGWSDGANIGLSMAIHSPQRVTKLFAFGGNSSPAGLRPFSPTAASKAFDREARQEYRALSPTPKNVDAMMEADEQLDATQPHFTSQELRSIRVRTWIVDGDRDQFIKRSDTDYLASQIPNAGELILPDVSHSAPLRNPDLFNQVLLLFLR